ncbi:Six-bladed beta-propeller TolB-like protein [Neofusicoccum parvum]|uniref:Six-bladed beta-propeller TolB-like protein n=1 Tax=Neofusicoccum parvum TaxID=310453 RepID=A0ACB5RZE1_9PEZI|nr:Six-bladed beta-propeller TolB-like protein [Neofusicoccum parvum]
MEVPANVKILSLAEKTLADSHLAALGDKDIAKTPFLVYHPSALPILGNAPSLTCVLEHTAYSFAHEAGVYLPSTKSVIVTSNRTTTAADDPHIAISRLSKAADSTWSWTELPPSIAMPNGGVNHPATGHVLLCSQGTPTAPSGLFLLDPANPAAPTPLLTHYHGRPFNSPNDVVVHPADGSVWFTDPVYGWEQGFRPPPALPGQVYRFDPAAGDVRVVADGFGRANGLCFAPDGATVYVTDTDRVHGDGTVDDARASTM